MHSTTPLRGLRSGRKPTAESILGLLLAAAAVVAMAAAPAMAQEEESTDDDEIVTFGEEIVVVEVKTTLRSEHVAEFLPKLRSFAGWFPDHRHQRIFGAVAYLDADSSVVVHAQRQGLFVIRATGSSASIVNDARFEPRVFS